MKTILISRKLNRPCEKYDHRSATQNLLRMTEDFCRPKLKYRKWGGVRQKNGQMYFSTWVLKYQNFGWGGGSVPVFGRKSPYMSYILVLT